MTTMAQVLKYPRWEHPEPGTKKSLFLSLLAHGFLALMFTVGLNWKTSSTPSGVEVELWDGTVPTIIEEVVVEKPIVPIEDKAEIVIQKKKEIPKPEVHPEKKPEPPKVIEKPKPKPENKVETKPKVEPPKEKAKTNDEVKEKPNAPPVDPKKEAALEKERADRLSKLRADAGTETGGSGGTTGSGTGTGGVSPGYADKVRRVVKPWINFPNAAQVEGNPAAQVLVETAPDGRIISKKLTRSSGLPDWDAAVLRALDATGTFPKDDNGTVPKSMVLIFKPKD